MQLHRSPSRRRPFPSIRPTCSWASLCTRSGSLPSTLTSCNNNTCSSTSSRVIRFSIRSSSSSQPEDPTDCATQFLRRLAVPRLDPLGPRRRPRREEEDLASENCLTIISRTWTHPIRRRRRRSLSGTRPPTTPLRLHQSGCRRLQPRQASWVVILPIPTDRGLLFTTGEKTPLPWRDALADSSCPRRETVVSRGVITRLAPPASRLRTKSSLARWRRRRRMRSTDWRRRTRMEEHGSVAMATTDEASFTISTELSI